MQVSNLIHLKSGRTISFSCFNSFISFNSQFLFYTGPSFTTIAAFGANSAVIHYTPTKETDAKINTTNLFLGKFFFMPKIVLFRSNFLENKDLLRHQRPRLVWPQFFSLKGLSWYDVDFYTWFHICWYFLTWLYSRVPNKRAANLI